MNYRQLCVLDVNTSFRVCGIPQYCCSLSKQQMTQNTKTRWHHHQARKKNRTKRSQNREVIGSLIRLLGCWCICIVFLSVSGVCVCVFFGICVCRCGARTYVYVCERTGLKRDQGEDKLDYSSREANRIERFSCSVCCSMKGHQSRKI